MWRRSRFFSYFKSSVCCAMFALGLTVGCATVEVVGPEHLHGHQFASGARPVAHIYADNWGWYLFKYIPIVTGNLDNPGTPRLPKFFTDNVRVDLLVDKVTEEGQKLGASVVTDLRVRDRSSYQPLTLIFWLNEYEVSANLSRLEIEGELPKTNQKME
ncbi:hypothetical protein [Petrachloros mirabilis]